jgi:hypothetical protein
MTISFARGQFPPAIIQHAVWLYLRFTLSYRDVENLLAERGVGHCHAATNLRSFWSPGSQWDGEDRLRWIPVPAGDH